MLDSRNVQACSPKKQTVNELKCMTEFPLSASAKWMYGRAMTKVNAGIDAQNVSFFKQIKVSKRCRRNCLPKNVEFGAADWSDVFGSGRESVN